MFIKPAYILQTNLITQNGNNQRIYKVEQVWDEYMLKNENQLDVKKNIRLTIKTNL